MVWEKIYMTTTQANKQKICQLVTVFKPFDYVYDVFIYETEKEETPISDHVGLLCMIL